MALLLVVTVVLALSTICFGAQTYKVGDSAGWTLQGVNYYDQWASDKKFQVGDTLVFNYGKQMHNVKQVSKEAFQSCNAASPIAAYNSGSDSIPIETPGDMYFICGVPGHCSAGMKVVVKVSPPTPNDPITPPNAAPTPSNCLPNLPINTPPDRDPVPMFPNIPNNTMLPYPNPNSNGNIPSYSNAPALQYSSKLPAVTVAFGVMGFIFF